MILTKAQLRGLWFIVIVFAASVILQYGKILFFAPEPFDFSDVEKQFDQKTAKILAGQLSPDTSDRIDSAEKPAIKTWKKFPVNINSANSEQLQYLPRIGPAMAERIITYRRQNGPFHSKEDLMKVKGIGKKTYEKLADFITIH